MRIRGDGSITRKTVAPILRNDPLTTWTEYGDLSLRAETDASAKTTRGILRRTAKTVKPNLATADDKRNRLALSSREPIVNKQQRHGFPGGVRTHSPWWVSINS